MFYSEFTTQFNYVVDVSNQCSPKKVNETENKMQGEEEEGM